MIKYIAQTLTMILQNIPSRDILSNDVRYNNIPLPLLEKIQFALYGETDERTIRRQLDYLVQWMDEEFEGIPRPSDMEWPENCGINVLDLIDCIAQHILRMHDGRPAYRYRELPAWHQMAGKIGTNLLVAALYAKRDHEQGEHRREFLWDTNIEHDNSDLKRIYKQGISDNHFHLGASAPYFILKWLSLMNLVDAPGIEASMKELDRRPRYAKPLYQHGCQDDDLGILHLKAALIRIFLYAELTGKKIKIGPIRMNARQLLQMLGEKENIFREYAPIGTEGSETVCGYLERRCGMVTTDGERIEEKVRYVQDNYPLTYWFFWEECAHLPIGVLQDEGMMFSGKNTVGIAAYLNKMRWSIPLEHCWLVFKDKRQEEFWRMWERQLRKNVDELLRSPENLRAQRKNIQTIIDSLKEDPSPECRDYALNAGIRWKEERWEKGVLSGERHLIYQMFYHRDAMRNGERDDMLYRLFFAYLVIKESFRMEILQNNDKSGFFNFQQYQRRKTWFMTAFSEWEMAQVAVRSAYVQRNLIKLEMRITPGDSCEENICRIRRYDRHIGKCDFLDGRVLHSYYVFHFHKKPDKPLGEEGRLRCRNEAFRRKLKRQANAIMRMREQMPEVGSRLKGVDACSSEDGCRPEVFAVAFRRLKEHTYHREDVDEDLRQLHITYHVGEENQDVLDGLRAINEAVLFLNLGTGDRLGHATMLGVNVADWYYKNDFTVVIRQQDYLDNLAWLYYQIIRFHITNEDNLLEYLESEFQKVFGISFECGLNDDYNAAIVERRAQEHGKKAASHRTLHFDIHNYYMAWKLRGDDPELYKEGFFKWPLGSKNFENQHEMNEEVEYMERHDVEAGILYHSYHYIPQIYEEGEKQIRVRITQSMIHGIELVQRRMQQEIAKKGIAIEVNPSSNVQIAGLSTLSTSVKIGGLAGYRDHPIVSFYNKGLTNNEQELAVCPQLNVSINTDDPGVFTTTLTNEYTLMAYALEYSSDSQGRPLYKRDMIYDWINNIRQMGNNQSFAQ